MSAAGGDDGAAPGPAVEPSGDLMRLPDHYAAAVRTPPAILSFWQQQAMAVTVSEGSAGETVTKPREPQPPGRHKSVARPTQTHATHDRRMKLWPYECQQR
jgi:hypothetical protein